MKQRLRSMSTYLLQASTAGGLDRTAVTEADPTHSAPRRSISLTMYTPVHSFPCVPPQTATRDSGGEETDSICCEEESWERRDGSSVDRRTDVPVEKIL